MYAAARRSGREAQHKVTRQRDRKASATTTGTIQPMNGRPCDHVIMASR